MHANRSHPDPKTVCCHTNSLRCAVIGHRVRIRSPVPVRRALSSITRAVNPAANPEICAGSKCCGSTSRNTGAAGLNTNRLRATAAHSNRTSRADGKQTPFSLPDDRYRISRGQTCSQNVSINNNETSDALMKRKHLEESKRRARSVKL